MCVPARTSCIVVESVTRSRAFVEHAPLCRCRCAIVEHVRSLDECCSIVRVTSFPGHRRSYKGVLRRSSDTDC